MPAIPVLVTINANAGPASFAMSQEVLRAGQPYTFTVVNADAIAPHTWNSPAWSSGVLSTGGMATSPAVTYTAGLQATSCGIHGGMTGLFLVV